MWNSREECSRNREQRQRKEAGIVLSLIFSLTCFRDRRPECLKYKKRLDRRKVRSGEAGRGLVGPLKYYLSVRTCDLSFLAHKFAPCMLSSEFPKPLLKGIGWCNYGCCQAQSLQWRLADLTPRRANGTGEIEGSLEEESLFWLEKTGLLCLKKTGLQFIV